jgi:hypothetical protein
MQALDVLFPVLLYRGYDITKRRVCKELFALFYIIPIARRKLVDEAYQQTRVISLPFTPTWTSRTPKEINCPLRRNSHRKSAFP